MSEESYILGVAGYDDTIRKARELIRGARHEVVVSAWGGDCLPLREELEAAEDAGRTVIIFCHTKVPFSVEPYTNTGLQTTSSGRNGPTGALLWHLTAECGGRHQA